MSDIYVRIKKWENGEGRIGQMIETAKPPSQIYWRPATEEEARYFHHYKATTAPKFDRGAQVCSPKGVGRVISRFYSTVSRAYCYLINDACTTAKWYLESDLATNEEGIAEPCFKPGQDVVIHNLTKGPDKPPSDLALSHMFNDRLVRIEDQGRYSKKHDMYTYAVTTDKGASLYVAECNLRFPTKNTHINPKQNEVQELNQEKSGTTDKGAVSLPGRGCGSTITGRLTAYPTRYQSGRARVVTAQMRGQVVKSGTA